MLMSACPEPCRNAIVPHLYVEEAAAAIDFYERAFGAEELFRVARSDGSIVHAKLSVCGSTFMIGEADDRLYGEPRRIGRCTAGLHVFSDDNETLFRRVVSAGSEPIQPPTDMFDGASSASVRDPFGHVWVLVTWTEDLTPEENEYAVARS